MKLVWMIVTLAFLLGGCVDENAYDGENGLQGVSTDTALSLSQIKTLLRDDADALSVAAAAMRDAVDEESAKAAFTTLMIRWKRTEALYVAGELSSSMIDLPAQIDAFHSGNTDIHALLDRTFENNTSLSAMLYQSVARSVNALEYTLYKEGELTQRRMDAAHFISEALLSECETIAAFYGADTQWEADEEESTAVLINQLIGSAYKLKEWRIGEAAGLVVKYRDDPDASRFEYTVSGLSLEAMGAIIAAHRDVMASGLGDIASARGAGSQAEAIVGHLDAFTALLESFDAPVEADATDARLSALYERADLLQNEYSALIAALSYTQTIIEADGD